MTERYYFYGTDVPEEWRGQRLGIYDRFGLPGTAVAVCTDPDIAERLVRLLNADEAARKEPTK